MTAAHAVCVYCSASTTNPVTLRLAAEVGAEIASRGWHLVYGGGNVSMMGALATAARAGGAPTVGVIPKRLVHKEMADVESTELIVTDTMRERKQVMDDRCQAFLVLPGGIGTLDEFFETWTGGYLGLHDKPVVVLDPHGHFRGLFAWIDSLGTAGYLGSAARARITITDNLAAAFGALAGRPQD